jgi:hypothetical protein
MLFPARNRLGPGWRFVGGVDVLGRLLVCRSVVST